MEQQKNIAGRFVAAIVPDPIARSYFIAGLGLLAGCIVFVALVLAAVSLAPGFEQHLTRATPQDWPIEFLFFVALNSAVLLLLFSPPVGWLRGMPPGLRRAGIVSVVAVWIGCVSFFELPERTFPLADLRRLVSYRTADTVEWCGAAVLLLGLLGWIYCVGVFAVTWVVDGFQQQN
ncbi:MAG: hypothetical protein AB7O43_08725 [Hyphomicrobiaceae bacterium]